MCVCAYMCLLCILCIHTGTVWIIAVVCVWIIAYICARPKRILVYWHRASQRQHSGNDSNPNVMTSSRVYHLFIITVSLRRRRVLSVSVSFRVTVPRLPCVLRRAARSPPIAKRTGVRPTRTHRVAQQRRRYPLPPPHPYRHPPDTFIVRISNISPSTISSLCVHNVVGDERDNDRRSDNSNRWREQLIISVRCR